MLFSWRKFLAGPVVKNAVQKEPWSPWSTGNSCSRAGGAAGTRANHLPKPSNDQLQVAHSHRTLKGFFQMCEEKELSLELLQNEINSREAIQIEQ